MYRCKNSDCGQIFDEFQTVKERHGLDCPPYESIAVCPYCKSADISEINPMTRKITVAERLLKIISHINRYTAAIEDIYGNQASNSDLDGALSEAAEFISELYEFLPEDADKAVMRVCGESDVIRVINYLDGESSEI